MISAEHEQGFHRELDPTLRKLLESPLPQIDGALALLEAHELLSGKLGAEKSWPPESLEEHQQLHALESDFSERIKSHYPKTVEDEGVQVIVRQRRVEALQGGELAYSLAVQIIDRRGETRVPNHSQLLTSPAGPVYLWVRGTPELFQVISLYSREAFESEIRVMKSEGNELLNNPEKQPLLMVYLLKEFDKLAALPGSALGRRVTAVAGIGEGSAFRLTTDCGEIECDVHRDTSSCNISYRLRDISTPPSLRSGAP